MSNIFVLMGKGGTGKDSIFKVLVGYGLTPMASIMNESVFSQINVNKDDYLFTGGLDIYKALKDKYGSDTVIPIYLEVDDGVRFQRLLDRERKKEDPKYVQLCENFLSEGDAFSDEKLKVAGIMKEHRFNADNVEECVRKILNYIN